MLGGGSRWLAVGLWLLLALAACSAAPSYATGAAAIRPSCWTPASLSEDPYATVGQKGRWRCGPGKPSIEAERVLLRFDLKAGDAAPRYLLSRRSALEAVHLLAIDEDGAVRRASIPAARLASSLAGGFFKAPLPLVSRRTRQIIVAVDLPSHAMTLDRAYLSPRDDGDESGDMRFLLILAGLAGTLAMPLIFNTAFYRVLREPFVVWHSLFTLSLLATILVTSGVAVLLFEPPAMLLSWLTTLLFGLSVAAGAMFTYGFIEPGMMRPSLRRLLPPCAAWAMGLAMLHAAFPFVARPIQSSLYTAAFAPILLVFVICMVDALRRGSRAARFQAIGYAPMILVGLARLVTGVIPSLSFADAMLLFYAGCIAEVLFTTLGMADRFITMKRDRDHARSEARFLERLAETDALTGLLNRRAIEGRFEKLRAEGYAAMAVVDLDQFKSINDARGHAIGDAVLKATASALRQDPSIRSFRLGGEEFVLLLRGDDATMAAERLRRAIPAAVADAVPGLGRTVTASMGITAIMHGEGFLQPYERADTLLYQAKSAGRNRTRCGMSRMLGGEPASADQAAA
ncbi:sensor domain-containing diguanylate cyclase [Sphingomonas sp. 3-13AW]|uniref:sensor domain-containing diguanylate cyclase n=1 Tax=Sphingomonas sp. 3-13AW TaxID=3050450 RepID=UPI003BB59C04